MPLQFSTKNSTTFNKTKQHITAHHSTAQHSTAQHLCEVILKESLFITLIAGVVHHIVVAEKVLDDLMTTSEALHGGMPFWQLLLNVRYKNKRSFSANILCLTL